MGKGFLRRRKILQMNTEVEAMRKQTEKLLSDPEGAFQKMAKPLIVRVQTAEAQANKLSALVCALLEAQGGTITLRRGAIDQFQQHRLTILTETNPDDDGINPDTDIVFSFKTEAVNQPPIDQPPAPVEPVVADAGEIEITAAPTPTDAENSDEIPADVEEPLA